LGIPVSSIWGLISLIKIRINDILILQYDNPREILKDIYYTKIATNFDSIKKFLNARVSTANISSLTAIDNTRTLVSGATTPYYCVSLGQVFDTLFRYRHFHFFKKIEVEFQMMSNVSTSTSALGLSIGVSGSSLSDLQINNLQMVLDIAQFKQSVPLILNSNCTNIGVNYFFKKIYPVTVNTSGTQKINFYTDFPPISVINKVFLYWTNSGVIGTLTSANAYQIYNTSYFTTIELQRNGTRQFILEDSEIYNHCITHQRSRGLKPEDSFYTNGDYLTKLPGLYISLERDKASLNHESSSAVNQVSTGIANSTTNGLWVMNISYDLTTAPNYLDSLVVLLSTTRIVTLYSGNKNPEVSY
jgi:hypothetical protein